MQYIKTVRKLKTGGKCANCNDIYKGNNGYSVICRYGDDGITEPFRLCSNCKDEIERERVLVQ